MANSKQYQGSEGEKPRQIVEGKVDLDHWVPYRMWMIGNLVGDYLEGFYRDRFEISRVAWCSLAVLACHAPISVSELAERANLDVTRASQAIRELAGKGFLSRRVDPRDRRRVVLRLSNKGNLAYGEISPLAEQAQSRLLKNLSVEDNSKLSGILDTLEEAAREISQSGLEKD